MKTSEDFRLALGQPDAGFDRAMRQALSALPAAAHRPAISRRSVWALAASLALLLGVIILGPGLGRQSPQPTPLSQEATGAVFPLRKALLEAEFSLSPEAEALLAQSARAGYAQTAHTAFTVEAVHDGAVLHFLIQAKALQAGYLLVDAQWNEAQGRCEALEAPIGKLFPDLAEEEGSVYDYARHNGLKLLLVSCEDQLSHSAPVFVGTTWYSAAETGGFCQGVSIGCLAQENALTETYKCVEYVVSAEGVPESISTQQITLDLPVGKPLREYTIAAPVPFEQVNATLDQITVYCTLMSTAVRYTCSYASDGDGKSITTSLYLKRSAKQGSVQGSNATDTTVTGQYFILEPMEQPNAIPFTIGRSVGSSYQYEKQEIRLVPAEAPNTPGESE